MSFVIESAFHFTESYRVKNAISSRFLCNSRRFSQITEEGRDYLKNLLIIDEFCPKETTKYYRSLTFSGKYQKEFLNIISNCIQLIDLTLNFDNSADMQMLISVSPITLKQLTITQDHNTLFPMIDGINSSKEINLPKDINLRELTNLSPFNISQNYIKTLPRTLVKLTLSFTPEELDMNLLPNLKDFEILSMFILNNFNRNLKFANSENHNLEKLQIYGKEKIYDCFFPNLYFLGLHSCYELSVINLLPLTKINRIDGGFLYHCRNLKKIISCKNNVVVTNVQKAGFMNIIQFA